MEKVSFLLDDGTKAEFYPLEQTKLSGRTYLLVTDAEEGDGDALILCQTETEKDDARTGGKELTYEVVSDDELLEALAPIFENLLEDIEITK
ncbi:MAG: DUF1292 domain-containing protein [Lachnospiraceae bacterium]|nr:DUF1292 domain-containing protein [Lachnospiraceae bacterium]